MLWFLPPLGLRFESKNNFELTRWCRNRIEKEPIEAVEMLAVQVHGVWLSRNKLVVEGKHSKHSLMVTKSLSLLVAYQKANECSKAKPTESAQNGLRQARWCPPKPGFYKLNTDAYEDGEYSWGIGTIIRDEEGECLAAATWEI